MSRTAAALIGALACLLAGCTGASPTEGAGPRPAAVTFARTTCDEPGGVAGRVGAFVDAYDRGEQGLADRFFAPAGRFRWYSEPGLRQGPAAYDRSTLDAYLTRREQAGDHLELVSVRPSGDGGDFSFTVRRGEALLSKGSLDCRSGLFVVWSLGPNPGP
jgi:hypothetical protein